MTMTIEITRLNVRDLNFKYLSVTSTLHPKNKGPNTQMFPITGPWSTRSKIGMFFLIIYTIYYLSYLTFIPLLCCIIFNFCAFIICGCSKSSYCLHPVFRWTPQAHSRGWLVIVSTASGAQIEGDIVTRRRHFGVNWLKHPWDILDNNPMVRGGWHFLTYFTV